MADEKNKRPEPIDPKDRAEWREQLGETYRNLTSWLTDEIEGLEKTSRERFQKAREKLRETIPPEEPGRILDQAEKEVQEFLGEMRRLGGQVGENLKVQRLQRTGTSVLRSGVAKVRAWAERVEEGLEDEGASKQKKAGSKASPPAKTDKGEKKLPAAKAKKKAASKKGSKAKSASKKKKKKSASRKPAGSKSKAKSKASSKSTSKAKSKSKAKKKSKKKAKKKGS